MLLTFRHEAKYSFYQFLNFFGKCLSLLSLNLYHAIYIVECRTWRHDNELKFLPFASKRIIHGAWIQSNLLQVKSEKQKNEWQRWKLLSRAQAGSFFITFHFIRKSFWAIKRYTWLCDSDNQNRIKSVSLRKLKWSYKSFLCWYNSAVYYIGTAQRALVYLHSTMFAFMYDYLNSRLPNAGYCFNSF